MLKPDKWILQMVKKEEIIAPFERKNIREVSGQRIFSYGLQPYGYDLRLSPDILIPKRGTVLDSKHREFEKIYDEAPVIPPHDYIVALTIETVKMPRGITGLIYGKSSLAEAGILINATPVDAGFNGRLRLCIANLNSVAIKLYAYEGIAQLLFIEGDGLPLKDYREKGGNHGKV
ncbi:dCTP deaminase [Hippea maritima]|uniref:Deoxycytidine triphosphate deaminase n=1 Tax=Hippea maritima (strain ATCC 700847 / DSM 10411 / MH2) TaxID=760142 RepID=F2LV49_HIPMA|nr:dCTP deaminase [Hippea maritima]AEA33633.1 deoxycytidine triphosphate deaminase [Hippea maritima DSM 10411]